MQMTITEGGFLELEFDHVGRKERVEVLIKFGVSVITVRFNGTTRSVRSKNKPISEYTVGDMLQLKREAVILASLGDNQAES
jgi:hypothetical protein